MGIFFNDRIDIKILIVLLERINERLKLCVLGLGLRQSFLAIAFHSHKIIFESFKFRCHAVVLFHFYVLFGFLSFCRISTVAVVKLVFEVPDFTIQLLYGVFIFLRFCAATVLPCFKIGVKVSNRFPELIFVFDAFTNDKISPVPGSIHFYL